MMNLPVTYKNNVAVMSSVDLAKLCVGDAKNAHSHFMDKAKKVLGDKLPNFRELEKYLRGEREILLLPEREACLMAMSYSYELQAWVYDEWQKEKNKRQSPSLPDFTNPVEAARAWADELEQKQVAQKQLAIAAPKAEFVDRYVDATGTYGFRQVAKMLSVKENWFSDFLIEKAIMYRLSGRLTAHSGHIDAGRFVARAGVARNEHSYTECRFTAKGVEWVAGEIAKSKAAAAIAKK